MSTYRLVYYSDNRLSAAASVPEEIESILDASRRNNALVGVTGALMFSGGYFIQVLEGAEEAVEATFERIQQDPRHGNVQLVAFEPVDEPSFRNWSMAYVGRPGESDDYLAGLGEKTGFDPAALDGQHLFQTLRERVLDAV